MSDKIHFEDLKGAFERYRETDPRIAAEIAYALAVKEKEAGHLESAREYANVCVAIFRTLEIRTLEHAAGRYVTINGVLIPDLIHDDVVKRDFADMGLM